MQLKVRTIISYQETEGGSAVLFDPSPRPVVSYETVHKTFLGIADGEGSGYEFDLPTGDICQIKALVIHNKTGQECNVELNGGDDFSIEDGDVWTMTMNSNDRDSPVYAVAVYTLNSQVGAGGLDVLVAGDTW